MRQNLKLEKLATPFGDGFYWKSENDFPATGLFRSENQALENAPSKKEAILFDLLGELIQR